MNKSRMMLASLAALAMTSVMAAEPAKTDSAKAQYDAERARCMSGTTGQDQASCLRSAGAAYDAIRRGRLRDPNTSYRANALDRCKNVAAADRADCESRVDGQGTSSGSVKDGGVIKETVTRNVNPSGTAMTNKPAPK